ncbi:MAG: DNA adenine methylase [Spirochaetales bacterium]|nr:DNA adenine methylase [Treponema berlinense]MDD7611709.1 DNA adenine methylase [Spirochaetales bacterium]MDY5915115.1 DNA adenine methylase [Treponema sp.]
MDYENSFLTEQIIAYIGNKRKLLKLIYKAIETTGIEIKPGIKFLDVFSGSGVVSRFAKMLNFEVFTNDWETYSKVINSAYLSINKRDISSLFGSEQKFKKLLEKINNLPEPEEDEQYIAKYYAPKENDINKVNYKTERLFYTRKNALTIDKIRNFIEKNYPSSSKSEDVRKIRNLLIAQLVYEAATHTNTSGVFKACHKEFGGHGKDALTRILTPIALHEPVLIDSDYECHVFQQDANKLVEELEGIDIAYLDPPYNQHQYGSNYHMLNTIAKWDKIPVPLEINAKGELKEKAGIRHDWVNTRSSYCYRTEAEIAFKDLINKLDAHYILISYSTDGIIPFDTMREICMSKGKTTIVTNEYTTYRGGKQSNQRKNTNIEFILCIDTKSKSNEKEIKDIDFIVAQKKIALTFKQKFSQKKLETLNLIKDNKIEFILEEKRILIDTDHFFTLSIPKIINELSTNEMLELSKLLDQCACSTKEEEINELIYIAKSNKDDAEKFIKLLPHTLKKLASKKNKVLFEEKLKEIKNLKTEFPYEYSKIEEKIKEVENQANIRFST